MKEHRRADDVQRPVANHVLPKEAGVVEQREALLHVRLTIRGEPSCKARQEVPRSLAESPVDRIPNDRKALALFDGLEDDRDEEREALDNVPDMLIARCSRWRSMGRTAAQVAQYLPPVARLNARDLRSGVSFRFAQHARELQLVHAWHEALQVERLLTGTRHHPFSANRVRQFTPHRSRIINKEMDD